ncbi:MAG TPA: hypothetical protein VHB54_19260 [Mucilaginibacter sp.]|nr:hypothetical protein [Mucilaginibacter sp.]
MPEFFDLSLLVEKSKENKQSLDKLLYKSLGLNEGDSTNNLHAFFNNPQILLSFFQHEDTDYDEIFVSLGDQTFHRTDFENELRPLTNFVEYCFNNCASIKFGLCSYELNAYVLRDVKFLSEINRSILEKFPIVFERSLMGRIELTLNPLAQQLW